MFGSRLLFLFYLAH